LLETSPKRLITSRLTPSTTGLQYQTRFIKASLLRKSLSREPNLIMTLAAASNETHQGVLAEEDSIAGALLSRLKTLKQVRYGKKDLPLSRRDLPDS